MQRVLPQPQAGHLRRDAPSAGAADSLQALPVLLLCENAAQSLLLVQLLQHLGAEVELLIVENGSFQLAQVLPQALVIVEADGLAGRAALVEIAARNPRPELMALSETAQPHWDMLRADGADAVLACPVTDLARLKAGLCTLLAGQALETELEGTTLEDLLRRVGAGHADSLAFQMQTDLVEVGGALRAAVDAADFEAIRVQTHLLVGVAGAAGGERLRGLAETLNRAARAGKMEFVAERAAQIDSALARIVPEIGDLAARLPGSVGE